jgi:hypothetical protein
MPRKDGTPTIMEMVVEGMMEDAGREGDPAEFIAQVKSKIGREPEYEDIGRELGIDPRRDKPWPPDEDCKGCDKHKDGPHRFGCTVHGKNQIVLSVTRK